MFNYLKKIAKDRVTLSPKNLGEFEEFLKIWWSKKYSLPINHDMLMELTLEELAIQFFEDYFEKNPKELENFEEEIGEARADSDEEWFKKQMGEDYTDKDYEEIDDKTIKKDEKKDEFIETF